MAYWLLKWFLVEPLFRLVCRPWIEGAENFPRRGPAIVVANHLSAGDTVLIPVMLPRRITFPAKIELFQGRDPKGRLLAWFLRLIRQRPLDRSGGQASASGMASVSEVLAGGDVLAIFPEGTRSPDGRLYRGKTGAARLVLAAGAPVVPVAVVDTDLVRVWPLPFPILRRPGVIVGKPMDFSEYAAAGNHRDSLRWVTDEMMNAIMELSGQTYVDVYGSVAKSAQTEGRPLDFPTATRPGLGRPKPQPIPAAPAEPAPTRSAG